MADLSEPMRADPSQHREELIERLDALRRNEGFCDVTVAVKGKEFKSHKVVLAAASPFFLSLLESNMRETKEQLIRIELEEATASVMEDVLKYIYTGDVVVIEESAHNLIATADYLLLPGLKTLACSFLKEVVTVENCVFNYYFADKYQCVELKETCCREINLNFTAVMATDDFLSLDMKQVMEWVCSDDVTVSAEEEVFKSIVKWVTHDKSERESCFPDLLRQVRLKSISHNFLLKKLVKEELVTSNNENLNFVLGSMESIFIPSGESGIKPPRKCLEMQVEGIFVCGGKKALCYLPCENMWYQLEDMTLEHQDHTAVQYRDKVYIFSRQRALSQVAEYYMPSTNSWGSIQTKFQYDEQFSSVSVLNGYSTLYALTNTEINPENTIFAYHPDENEWNLQRGDDLEEYIQLDRWGACGVSDGHHLYIIGGTDKNYGGGGGGGSAINGTTRVERFDPSGNHLEKVAALNEARHGAFGAAMNGKIYVAAGLQNEGSLICTVLKTCEMYTPCTDEWHLMPSLKVPRHSASMVCFKGALYVVGGLKDSKQSRELSVEMFDSEASEWKEKCTIPVSHENQEERNKENHYQACFATIHKDVLENPVVLHVEKCSELTN